MDQFYNINDEKCLLAILLLENQMIDIVQGRIDKEVFYNKVNRDIYVKICEQWHKDKRTNLVSLSEAGFDAAYLSSLSSAESSTSVWESYVNSLNKMYKARQLKIKLAQTSDKLTSDNANELASELTSILA